MTVTIALPSKGRIKDGAAELVARAGLEIVRHGNDRSYRAGVRGLAGVAVMFLSAAQIARALARGGVDLGIVGEDLLREEVRQTDPPADIRARLGFGRADVAVAVPEVWLDVDTMADLGDVAGEFRYRHGRRLRVATKYGRLTRQFFSARHGIQVYRIIESLGATEGAPAAGHADIVVDITSTGSTLAANRLKALDDGVILRSEACLVQARTGKSDETERRLLHTIVERIAAAA